MYMREYGKITKYRVFLENKCLQHRYICATIRDIDPAASFLALAER